MVDIPPGALVVTARMPIKAESREAYLAGVVEHAAAARAKPGVFEFRVYEDIETPNTFVQVEVYADQQAADAHIGGEVAREFIPKLPGWLAADSEIMLYTASEVRSFPVSPA